MDKCKEDQQKALFFVQNTLVNNWSRAVLLNFLDTKLFDRQGKAVTNFEYTLPPARSDLAQELTKDPYNFDFITLTKNYNEKELKDALMDNITAFLLELGNGFAFVGRVQGKNVPIVTCPIQLWLEKCIRMGALY